MTPVEWSLQKDAEINACNLAPVEMIASIELNTRSKWRQLRWMVQRDDDLHAK